METIIFGLPPNVQSSWHWSNGGKNIYLFKILNIMNNLDVATRQLMDSCLVATYQIKFGAW
jgi:hypothetical protein